MPSMEMPKYKCHKEVHALRIRSVTGHTLNFYEAPFSPRRMTPDWIDKHEPKEGGYFVVYEDGYESFSPQEAFEGGYTRL